MRRIKICFNLSFVTKTQAFFVFLVIGWTLNSSLAQAEWNLVPDLKLGMNGRTYPIGAQITGTAGIGQLLWSGEESQRTEALKAEGKVPADRPNWKYGYVRLAMNAATSVVVNRIGAEFQVYPISILGFGLGYDYGWRNFVPKTIDCSGVECNGVITRKYLRMQALAAYRGFVLQVLGRYEELRAPDATKPFFDEMTLVTGNSAGEKVLTWTPVLLYTINPKWQAGAALLYSHSLDSGGDSALYGPVVGHRAGKDWTLLAGVGLNRSPVVHSAMAGFFMIQYMIKGGLGLTDQIASESQVPDPKNEI